MTWILGVSGPRYLLVENDDVGGDLDDDTQARVLNSETGELFPPENVHTLLAHNPYFDPYEGSQSILDELLDEAEVVEPGERSDL